MAQSLVGLVGSGKGPRLTVPGKVTSLFAVVAGLPKEEYPVEVHVTHEGGLSTFLMLLNGRMEIPVGCSVQFEYRGKNIIICTVEAN